jgi:hypothetical protein
MPIDNFKQLAPLLANERIDDRFWYTEIIDRKDNSSGRLKATFYHYTSGGLLAQQEEIIAVAKACKARAYLRLTARNLLTVGREFTKRVVDSAMNGCWGNMRTMYNSVAARHPAGQRLWLVDFDGQASDDMYKAWLRDNTSIWGIVPSKTGTHWIVLPFNKSKSPWTALGYAGAPDLHLDNPTNLYIPDEAP